MAQRKLAVSAVQEVSHQLSNFNDIDKQLIGQQTSLQTGCIASRNFGKVKIRGPGA